MGCPMRHKPSISVSPWRPEGAMSTGSLPACEEFFEFCELRGFHEVDIETCFARGAAIFGASVACHRNEFEVLIAGRSTPATRELISIHAREADVHERRIGGKGSRQSERFDRIVRHGSLMPPE